MGDLFGGKWEREQGAIGGDRFYAWADVIEDMPKEIIREKFTELECRFKIDVQKGKDIWPPTLALFIALEKPKSEARVNESMYQPMRPELPQHTKEEYQEMGATGIKKLREAMRGEK